MPSKEFRSAVYQFIKPIVGSLSLALMLLACASAPIAPNTEGTGLTPTRLANYEAIAALPPTTRSAAAIGNARLALEQEAYDTAQQFLLLVRPSPSGIAQAALALGAQLAQYSSDLAALDAWFESNTANKTTPAALQYQLNSAYRNGDYPSAAHMALTLSHHTRLSDAESLMLWQALKTLKLDTVKQLELDQPSDARIARGWTSLAVQYLNNGGPISAQAKQLARWQAQWPDHPAVTLVAADITAINARAQQLLKTTVVALPLSGRLSSAGKAIQSAIMAAHLDRPQFEQVIFIDSAAFETSTALLAAANKLQPDVIIGPIRKSLVSALALDATRTTALISLNNFTPNDEISAPAFQLSLNIEDEADLLARVAPQAHTRALIFTTDNSLAQRATLRFGNIWAQRESAATIHTGLSVASNYSKEVEAGFLLTDSHARKTLLENIFVEKMESNPRRRQDIDTIFLSATASQARAINPLLAYHYAGDLPVFSPSIIFDGERNSVANSDLSGIVFSDTPWAIEPHTLRPQLRYHTSNGGAPSKNLHALGIDAYYLAARTGLWKAGEQHSFNGLIGQLQIHPDGSTKRVPTLALITKKRVKPHTLTDPQ